MSQTCIQVFLGEFLTIFVNNVNCIFGWNSDNAFWIIWFLINACGFAWAFSLFCLILTRYVTIVVYKRILPVDDNFMATFLLVWTFGQGFWMSFVLLFSDKSFHVLSDNFNGLYIDGHQFSPVGK